MARPAKPIPGGFRRGEAVKITSRDLHGAKLGLVVEACKYNDGGINVYLTGLSQYVCIQTERGDTIAGIEKKREHI